MIVCFTASLAVVSKTFIFIEPAASNL